MDVASRVYAAGACRFQFLETGYGRFVSRDPEIEPVPPAPREEAYAVTLGSAIVVIVAVAAVFGVVVAVYAIFG
jgi:hypothetical protein